MGFMWLLYEHEMDGYLKGAAAVQKPSCTWDGMNTSTPCEGEPK